MDKKNISKEELAKYESQFDESKLEGKLSRFAKKAGLNTVYYVLLLWEVLKSGGFVDKVAITAALGYFISPIDLIPDIILGTGFVDDAAVLLAALGAVASAIKPAMKVAAKNRLHKWFSFRDSELNEKYR